MAREEREEKSISLEELANILPEPIRKALNRDIKIKIEYERRGGKGKRNGDGGDGGDGRRKLRIFLKVPAALLVTAGGLAWYFLQSHP